MDVQQINHKIKKEKIVLHEGNWTQSGASLADTKATDNLQLAGDSILQLAWERFTLYDNNAKYQRTSFEWLQRAILVLGVFGTLLALTQTTLKIEGLSASLLDQVLHHTIVIVPITISILLAAANRFNAGNKWILLRANAEAIKREIYRYRARAEIYSDQQTARTSHEEKLARKLQSISRELMQTEVNLLALRPYQGSIPPQMDGAEAADDGLSFLTPNQYLTVRLGDQLNFFQLKTAKLEQELKRLEWLIYIVGGAGTFLAAVGLELWIALTTALMTAFTAYLKCRQVESTLTQYNQVATDLVNIRNWWMVLSAKEQASQQNIDKLVGYTEKVLQNENAGWVQRMQDALAELHAEQTKEWANAESN